MEKKQVIFCDFDGTVTYTDNILEILMHFDPPGWKETAHQLVHKEISLKQALICFFQSFNYEEISVISDWIVKKAKIRPGFQELLNYCRLHDIEFYITSSGIDFIIHPILASFPIPKEHIFCNHMKMDGQKFHIEFLHQCEHDCGMCKPTIISKFPATRYERILIGDSISDFHAAKHVDTIYACSHLIAECQKQDYPYTPFNDFYDIKDALKHINRSIFL